MLAVLSVHFWWQATCPSLTETPELCSSLSRCAGHLLPWAVKRKSPLLMLCPLEPVLESLCLQVTPARG